MYINKIIYVLAKYNFYLGIIFGIIGIFVGGFFGYYEAKYKILKNFEEYNKYSKFVEYSNQLSFSIFYYLIVCFIFGLILPSIFVIIVGYYLFVKYFKKNN